MPLYLVRYVGSGSREDPWKPRGSQQPGATWIQLKTPGNPQSSAFALLHLPIADSDPQLEHIGDDKDEVLQGARKNRLENVLGIGTLAASTPKQAVAELLISPPAGRWNPLQPTREQFEIWLNHELWFQRPR